MSGFVNAPPEVKAQYVERERQLNPEFANTPFAAIQPDQAFDGMLNALRVTLGISGGEPPNSYQEYKLAQKDPAYASHLEGSRPKGTSVNLSVNTAENFYSSLAKDQAAKFSALAEAADAALEAPGLLEMVEGLRTFDPADHDRLRAARQAIKRGDAAYDRFAWRDAIDAYAEAETSLVELGWSDSWALAAALNNLGICYDSFDRVSRAGQPRVGPFSCRLGSGES